MGLRSFHLLFIAISALLAIFFAAWAIQQFQDGRQLIYVVSAVLGAATAAGLAAYGVTFQRKTRGM